MMVTCLPIAFNYNVLRTTRDAPIVTIRLSGARTIPFLKIWMIFPSALLITHLYTRFFRHFPQEIVLYRMISRFSGPCALYPAQNYVHPHALVDGLKPRCSTSLHWSNTMIRYRSSGISYAISELWSSTVLFILFWSFTNHATTTHKPKQFYGLFSFEANFSGIVVGVIVTFLTQWGLYVSIPRVNVPDKWLYLQTVLLLLAGVTVLVPCRWVCRPILEDPLYRNPQFAAEQTKTKTHLSLHNGAACLARSRCLLSKVATAICYDVAIGLTEATWKHRIREACPNTAEFNLYMNSVVTAISIVATLEALFVTGDSVGRFGWTVSPMVTPLILLAADGLFFLVFFSGARSIAGITTPNLVLFLESVQSAFIHSAKYTVFDLTKKLVSVPPGSIAKLERKAAIDEAYSHLGKSCGPVVYQIPLPSISGALTSTPHVTHLPFACDWALDNGYNCNG